MDRITLLFNCYKEDVITDCQKFKKMLISRYGVSIRESGEVYVKIVNYQIDKYGSQLSRDRFEDYDDYKHKVDNAKQRNRKRFK